MRIIKPRRCGYEPRRWRELATFGLAATISLGIACSGCGSSGSAGIGGEPGTAVIHQAGWSTPVKLGFNDDGWEDSPYLTRDGRTILFFYHPFPDLITKLDEAIASGIDGKIYISERPFTNKRIHPVSTPDPATECCPYISESGEFFYVSNLQTFELQRDVPEKIYIDGTRIDLGTGGEESNPHYCAARDELWFDCPGDQNICVLRDAGALNYTGTAEHAPAPINLEGTNNSQPFLTDDCKTMYFTSDRSTGERPEIFVTNRNSGGGWSEPRLFVSEPAGVGEISMTADGREMLFAQIFDRSGGGVGIDLYYAAKTD